VARPPVVFSFSEKPFRLAGVHLDTVLNAACLTFGVRRPAGRNDGTLQIDSGDELKFVGDG